MWMNWAPDDDVVSSLFCNDITYISVKCVVNKSTLYKKLYIYLNWHNLSLTIQKWWRSLLYIWLITVHPHLNCLIVNYSGYIWKCFFRFWSTTTYASPWSSHEQLPPARQTSRRRGFQWSTSWASSGSTP